MYKAPFRVVMQKFAPKRQVSHCFYIDSMDIYLLQVLNQQSNTYYLEVYTMNFRFEEKVTGQVYKTRIPDESGGSEVRQHERIRLEKLSVTQLPSRIRQFDFYVEKNYVCLGLASGAVMIFSLATELCNDTLRKTENLEIQASQLSKSFGKVIHTSYFWRTLHGKFGFPDMQESYSIQEYTALSVTPITSLKHHSSVKSL